MALNSFALRTAIITRLKTRLTGVASRIYSIIPDATTATFPYVRLGQFLADSDNTKTEDMQDYLIPIHIFSELTESTEEAEIILADIFTALNNKQGLFDVDGFAVINCTYQGHNVAQGAEARFADDKYVHLVTRYRIQVQSYAA